MPGPRMGARPHDFDEKLVRESPTFKKWEKLPEGANLRYACRDFIKGHGEDEERLMRRIMIARRNNLRDHEILKQARAQLEQEEMQRKRSSSTSGSTGGGENKDDEGNGESGNNANQSTNGEGEKVPSILLSSSGRTKRRRCATAHSMTDEELRSEMDVPAIEATRSYKAWVALPLGKEFTYNQKYIKGREGHDWLLRKNIWRRMRYRRQNKVIVDKLKHDIVNENHPGVILPAPSLNVRPTLGVPPPQVINEVEATASVACEATNGATEEQQHLTVTAVYDTSTLPLVHVNEGIEYTRVYPDANAVATATQIVDHSLLTASTSGDGNNLGNDDAVVEAAVAAAESYVKQARESVSNGGVTNDESIGLDASFHPTVVVKNERDAVAVAAASGVVEAVTVTRVHNPIIADQSGEELEDHHATPNPLVNFDGDALDVAAKLAAAASVQVECEKVHEGEAQDGNDSGDNKDCTTIQI